MATLDAERIKSLRRKERTGLLFAGIGGVALVGFAVCFAVAQTLDLPALRTATLVCAPVIIALSAAVSAFYNIRYGGETERLVKEYVRGVFVENAALMHPEKEVLNFYFSFVGGAVTLTVNKFKEEITFDFSAFGKLSAARRSFISSVMVERLCVTYCRLYGRGAKYKTVCYTVRADKKEGKPVYIILDGEPDKKAYRTYLKSR